MRDIQSEEDIKILIDKFYTKVVADPVIGYIFTEVIALSWKKHIPIMNSFWCSILLGSNTYMGNPMIKHFELNDKIPLTENHFNRWLQLWSATIDENFAGEKAEEAKTRARNIAGIMQHKIAQR
jgi:hemoglobin